MESSEPAQLERFGKGGATIAFPVLVVDSPVIECSLDASGELSLREVSTGEFRFDGLSPMNHSRQAPCVRVVNRDALVEFAVEARRSSEAIRGALKPWVDGYHERQQAIQSGWGAVETP